MKKSLSYILLLTISIAALGACGNKETASSQNPDNSPHNSTTTKFSKAKEVGIYQAIHNNKNPMIWYRVEGNPSKDAYPTIFIFKDNKVLSISGEKGGITLGSIAKLNTTNPNKILDFINPEEKIDEYTRESIKQDIENAEENLSARQKELAYAKEYNQKYGNNQENISNSEERINFAQKDLEALKNFDTKIFQKYQPISFSILTSDSGNETMTEIIEFTTIQFSTDHNSSYEERIKSDNNTENNLFKNFPLFIAGLEGKISLTGMATSTFPIYDSEFTGFYTGNGGLFVTLFDGKTKYIFDSPKTKGIQVD